MSFIDDVRRARALLREEGRISLRGLQRELGLAEDALEALVEELVDAQRVASRDGKVLCWLGAAADSEGAGDREAERRQLTVLFCDLVGSTELSQRIDAEDLRELLRAYQQAASGVVARYEGHVAQLLGDGLLVYFGFPRAHEDDAERAVRAAVEIPPALASLNERAAAEHGVRLAVRVGIHTGPVVVGEMGPEGHRQTLALGDTTNIAARLQGLADPDAIVISEATRRLARRIVSSEDLGTRTLKGVAEPIRIHRLRSIRSGPDRAGPGIPSGPLVGRNEELGLLRERWERARAGAGQVVLLSGEPGVGKSRLAAALRETCARRAGTWMEAQCVPFLANSALHPFVALLEGALGLPAAADPGERWERLRAQVAAWPWARDGTLAIAAGLLSIPLGDGAVSLRRSPERQRQDTLAFLCDWVLAETGRRPLALAIEDLHWADASTLEAVARLADRAESAPFLLLATARPGFQAPWPDAAHRSRLTLERLSPAETRTVAQQVARRALPQGILEQVVERSDGVPLFAEELTRSALESEDPTLPATLQDSLAARLDRMGEGKRLAQLAAVLGREFGLAELHAVSEAPPAALGAQLEQLTEAGILFRRGAGASTSFVFKHALIRDAAYESLLKRTRRELHARVGRTLATRFASIAQQQPERLAHHFTSAALPEEAAGWWLRAAQRALARHAASEAIGHVHSGMAEIARLPPSAARDSCELELQMALGPALEATRGYGTAEVEACFSRAHQLCRDLGESTQLFPALRGLYVNALLKGDMTTAEARARELDGLAADGEPGQEVEASFALGQVHLFMGAVTEGVARLEQAFHLYDRERDRDHARIYGQDPGPWSLQLAAYGSWHLGRPDGALEWMEQALALARAIGHPNTLAAGLNFAAALHGLRGEPGAAVRLAAEQIEVSQEQSLRFWEASGRFRTALVRLEGGDGAGGLVEVSEAIDALAATGSELARRTAMVELARAEAAAGRWTACLRHADESCAEAERHGQLLDQPELHRLRGEALAQLSEADAAEDAFRRGLEIAAGRGQRSYALRTATCLARLWKRQHRRAQAQDLLQGILGCFTEGFATRDLREAKALLEELR